MTNSRPVGYPRGVREFLLVVAVVTALLLFLFFKALLPDYTVFSNDGPYGRMVPPQNRLPAILTGLWQDLNWLGGAFPAPSPNLTTLVRLVTTPLFFSKFYPAFSLFVVSICAWFCFRRYKFSPIACLLVAVAVVLNSDFVGTAAWGVITQPVAFGMNFLALAALADTTSPRRWLRVVLAGFAVGLGVSEAYDIGALFSIFVAAFAVFQSLVTEGPRTKRVFNAVGRLAVVAICAGFIASAALATLIGTQIKGVVGMAQDAESKAERWNQVVQYSIPKIETLGFVVPGLFGIRGDSPDGAAYWGRGGSDVSWDEFVDSGGKSGKPDPRTAFRAGAGSNYAGVLVVLIALFGIAQLFRKQCGVFSSVERKIIWFWGGVVIVGLLLMYGRFAPFFQFFYALPYASTIRNPAKFHHVAQWALLIVFAYGAEALCRIGFNAPATAASGLGAQWKSFWAKATGFDRKWVAASALVVLAFGMGWLILAATRGKLEDHLVELTRLQFLGMGYPPETAAAQAANTAESARATAKFAVGQVGRSVMFIIPAVALVAISLSGYFRGPRAKIGGALLVILLIADLLPFAREWVVFVNWKQKYESNSVMEFLRPRPYEQRITQFPVDSNRLPPEIAQRNQLLQGLYATEWIQHLFAYYNIQCLDVTQEPRVGSDKVAYESVMLGNSLRRWELGNTRYLFGVTALASSLNQLDGGKNRFRVAHQFDFASKPGMPGRGGEEITTVSQTNAPLSIFEFTGALPRVKLYTNWKVSTNDPTILQNWVKNFQNGSRESISALAAQPTVDLATLHELVDPAFDPQQTVLLSEALPSSGGTNQDPGEVKFDSYAPKHIVLSAKAASPSVLLLNDKFDPNWRVTIDGQPAKLMRANFIMRAVFIEKPGEHRIEFKYQPSRTALWISLLAVGILVGVAVWLRVDCGREANAGENEQKKQ